MFACVLLLHVCTGPVLNRDQFLRAFVDATSGTTHQLCCQVFEQLKSRGFAGEEDTISMPTLLQVLQQFHEGDIRALLETTRKLSADVKGEASPVPSPLMRISPPSGSRLHA